MQDYTQFFMTSQPLDYFDDLIEYLYSKQIAYRISGSTLRVKFVIPITVREADEENKEAEVKDTRVDIQILKVDDNIHCVRFNYQDAASKRDLNKSGPFI